MKHFYLILVASVLMLPGALQAEPGHAATPPATDSARNAATNPRVQWKEFDKADTRMFFIAGLQGKMDSTGTLRVTYLRDGSGDPIRGAEILIGDKSYKLPADFFPYGWLVTNFPSKNPFAKDTYRTLNLDFRIVSSGKLDDVRAFASLKPTRDMSFHCQWGEGDSVDHGAVIKLSEDAKIATAEVYKGNNTIVPGVTGAGTVEYTSSGKNGLQFDITWSNGKLSIKQDPNQSPVFHGEFKLGADTRQVSCNSEKND